MGVYSTLWEADDWATRGGLEKINWSKAPFYAYYKDFDIEGCPVPGPSSCASNPSNWWEGGLCRWNVTEKVTMAVMEQMTLMNSVVHETTSQIKGITNGRRKRRRRRIVTSDVNWISTMMKCIMHNKKLKYLNARSLLLDGGKEGVDGDPNMLMNLLTIAGTANVVFLDELLEARLGPDMSDSNGRNPL
ncbi:probable xyloglucan endotransglucosylase/hydrolase protein 6 [Tanacetum coccineum]